MDGTQTPTPRQRELHAEHLVKALGDAARVADVPARCILFATPLVRAILDGRKTVTRRLVTPQPVAKPPGDCPLGRPGDHLRVREKWGYLRQFYDPRAPKSRPYAYAADGLPAGATRQPWRPSLHMPRDATRILLEITGVRAERLTGITPGEALAEGCPEHRRRDPVGWFKEVWDRYYAAKGLGWEANPWVWVIRFRNSF